MADAWKQLADFEAANNRLRRAQLARESSCVLWRRAQALKEGPFLQLTAPIHPRVRLPGRGVGRESAYRALEDETELPRAGLSSAFRRISRPLGSVRRRQQRQWTRDVIRDLAGGRLRAAGPTPIRHREMVSKCELIETADTHAFGLVFKIENGTAKYLLVKPTDGTDNWVLPKGHIEKHEGNGETALREVFEETGVRARMIGCVGAVTYATDKELVRGKGYLLEFVCQWRAKEDRGRNWFRFEELADHKVPEEARFLLTLAATRVAATPRPAQRN